MGLNHTLAVSWAEVFESEDPKEVERRCEEKGLSVEWLGGRVLKTRVTLPGVVAHPETGRKVWFNQAHTFLPTRKSVGKALYAAYKLMWRFESLRQGEAHFGTGERIPVEMIDCINEEMSAREFVKWEPGDVVILDNYRMLHGREAYRGKREVFAAMW